MTTTEENDQAKALALIALDDMELAARAIGQAILSVSRLTGEIGPIDAAVALLTTQQAVNKIRREFSIDRGFVRPDGR